MPLNEADIVSQAPNPAAAANGRSLSRKGAFSNHCQSEAGKVFWADCAGSGSKPYHVSLDFAQDEHTPVARCSCPSRQFPCKHALGLMFELIGGTSFAVAPIPDDLLAKRSRLQARKEKPAQPKTPNTAAQKKKISRQLEGLEIADRIAGDLVSAGVSTLAGTSQSTLQKVAKDLGGYYLTGPQTAFQRIALTVCKIQEAPQNAQEYYRQAVGQLVHLRSTIQKSRAFLSAKLDSGNYGAEDSVLFEALGGVWRLDELRGIQAFRENVRLLQLSFDISPDEAKGEFVERGFWLNLETGEIGKSLNLRPVKALKYVKSEDSCFDVLEIPTLYQYPGGKPQRIRWERASNHPLNAEDLEQARSLAAADIRAVVKEAKGQFKNTLMPKTYPALLCAGAVGTVDGRWVLEDPAGNRICLGNASGEHPDAHTLHRMAALPVAVAPGDALFGLLYYQEAGNQICFQPMSVVTAQQVIRLLY